MSRRGFILMAASTWGAALIGNEAAEPDTAGRLMSGHIGNYEGFSIYESPPPPPEPAMPLWKQQQRNSWKRNHR